jgi:hypothetical protein
MQRENVVDWVLWALFASKREDALDEWREELDEYISSIEGILDRKLENGRNEDVKSMRVTFDPVRMLHRPLIWYMVSLFPGHNFQCPICTWGTSYEIRVV